MHGSIIFSRNDKPCVIVVKGWKVVFKTKHGMFEWLIILFRLANSINSFQEFVRALHQFLHVEMFLQIFIPLMDNELLVFNEEFTYILTPFMHDSINNSPFYPCEFVNHYLLAKLQWCSCLKRNYEHVLFIFPIMFDPNFGTIFVACEKKTYEKSHGHRDYLFKVNQLYISKCSMNELLCAFWGF